MALKINERSKDSNAMLPYWDKVTAITEGYEAIKASGTAYLPKFNDELDSDYKTRLSLTKFTNIYRDVLEGLATKPFEEECRLLESSNPPEEIKAFCENVDGAGNNLTVFSALSFFNGINDAVSWIFVDYPAVDQATIRTLADQKAAQIKPYWSHILARNVLEARSEIIGSNEQLSYFRYLEPACDCPERIRVFERKNGLVTWQLWEKTEKLEEYVIIEEGVLTIDVIPVVPFITGRRDGRSFKFFPPMRDAADLQISLYQDESALQFIKTMAGYPMLSASGMTPEKNPDGTAKKLNIGPMKVLYGKMDGAGNIGRWEYIEPSATSMDFLQRSIDQTKLDLRELGRQPLTAQSGQLTTVTTAVAAGKARSAVSAWALMLKDALENAFVITAKWMGIEYDPEVNVFTEFDNILEGDVDLTALAQARQNGDLSRETYWLELQRRKVLSPEFNAEIEIQRLLDEIPSDNLDPNDPNDLAGKQGQ